MKVLNLLENAELYQDATPQSIAFVSDLHFDYTEGDYCPEQAEIKKDRFIRFLKIRYPNTILCIAGDCFNNYSKTLEFVEELEQNGIEGFYVLGNHDYWNDGTKTIDDVVQLFSTGTENNRHFRFLITGRKYYLGALCFIGDTGWTSFSRKGKTVDFEMFGGLPEVNQIKDFQPEEVVCKHNEWIKFANDVLLTESKVIVLTHFPMTDFSSEDEQCWWSSETNLVDTDNCWKIFGHTHEVKQKKDNNISSQVGYYNVDEKRIIESEKDGWPYTLYDEKTMGILNASDGVQVCTDLINVQKLKAFYIPCVFQNSCTDMEMKQSIKRRGYRRCASNKGVFEALASDYVEYIEIVERTMGEYIQNEYIGYEMVDGLSAKTIQGVYSAIQILKRIFENNDFSRPQEFITAAIVTGYAYNGMPYLLDSMRPIDDYDIIRFYLMFVTMRHFQICVDAGGIRRHHKNGIIIGGIEVYLPVISGKCLTVQEALAYLGKTTFLTDINVSNISDEIWDELDDSDELHATPVELSM